MEPRLERALADLYGEPVPTAELVPLPGHASTRRYFRARIRDDAPRQPNRLIVMQLPEDAFGSDEGGEQPDTSRLPFLEVAELLASRGLPVPEVYAVDLANGVVLLEDLGDVTLHDELQRTPACRWPELYGRAVDLLAELHSRCETLPDASIVRGRCFDRALLAWELDHFQQWGIEAWLGELDGKRRSALREAFATIVGEIESMPCGFVHRDYQSKNLMVRPSGELTVIDFQDALRGPRVYDLVALLCDSYIDLDADLQGSMIQRYAGRMCLDPEIVRREFWWVALQRKLKDAGRFVYIDRVRHNPDFLAWFPQSLVYVGRAIANTAGLRPLDRVLRDTIAGFPDAVQAPRSSWR